MLREGSLLHLEILFDNLVVEHSCLLLQQPLKF